MDDAHSIVKPVAQPQVFVQAYSDDHHARILNLVRENEAWSLILSQHLKKPEAVVATNACVLPEGSVRVADAAALSKTA